MREKTGIRLFWLMVIVLPLATWGLLSWYEKKIEPLPVISKPGHRIADFHFTNQKAEQISSDSWKDKIVVVDFFFTHCPVICPKMTVNLKKVNEYFANDRGLVFSSFTVDPERDSPQRLQEFADRFAINQPNWDLLTGDKKELYKLARNSFKIVATDGDGGPTDFIHSEQLVLIDKQKRIRGYYKGTEEKEVEQLIRDIKKLKHEN